MASAMSLEINAAVGLAGMAMQLSAPSDPPPPADPVSAAWRIRDMADSLLSPRKPSAASTANKKEVPMEIFSKFDVEATLSNLRSEKTSVIQASFEAAAAAALDSRQRPLPEDDKEETISETDLPPVLLDAQHLNQLRSESFLRAFDNKEWAKRKTTKPSTPNKTSSLDLVTTSKTEKLSPSAPTSKGKKPGRGRKREGPKFTRNTPASSASALDSRLTSSRAILCAAANVAFSSLTPPLPGLEIDVTDVPQNPNKERESPHKSSTVSNLGAVVVEAQTLGQRVESVAINAARRATNRYKYRRDNLKSTRPTTYVLPLRSSFKWRGQQSDDDDDNLADTIDSDEIYSPATDSITEAWANNCLPRFTAILQRGSGHALFHDTDWTNRHGRIANLFEHLSRGEDENFGPHLIVCTEPDVERFGQEFRGINTHLRLINLANQTSLRAIRYAGTIDDRRRLRKQFPKANGLPEAAFHVIITSYASFLKDYLHFCHVPFEIALMDDGVSWMAAAQGDSNSPIGQLWDNGIWSKSDQQIGLAGTNNRSWDFSADTVNDDQVIKESWIGLTARHRLLTSSTTRIYQRSNTDLIPVSGLVNFIAPHYADVVREEWDRSRISNDPASMEHFRRLLTKSCVVHAPADDSDDMYSLSMSALNGELGNPDRTDEPSVPTMIPDEQFVSDGKVAYSRRVALQWLGTQTEKSWLRYELGTVAFQTILHAMKTSIFYGHLCEEITTSSTTTSTGASGQIAGSQAFRLALRCGRQFGSEQGLRQHLSALHAPPGTWLCRTCGSDCITSQARTHHERSCGQPAGGSMEGGNSAKAPTGERNGRQQHGPAGVVGKKKGSAKASKAATTPGEEKDADGSIRVPGYRGVWIDAAGKHFVKLGEKRLTMEESSDLVFFDTAEDAAKRHDTELKKTGGKTAEFNYEENGSRIVYEDVTTSSTSGLGGSANSVVPALSIINIKDLPTHVKPLLRDPRQTSRTGGNSKRHVYAYRGVCRQARKGHDRWQSQISFMGVNHYLGTFDSEWDAAAIYAWAHLILYGEEATKQAQKEGEEAAAAYESEKKLLEAGKMPVPQQQPQQQQQQQQPQPPKETKKRKVSKKKDEEASQEDGDANEKPAKRKRVSLDEGAKGKSESLVAVTQKAVSKAPVLSPRASYKELSDIELSQNAATKILAARSKGYRTTDMLMPSAMKAIRACIPAGTTKTVSGGAMLLGLSPSFFGWDAAGYIAGQFFETESDSVEASRILSSEFGQGGSNERFRSCIQGTTCIIGHASERTLRCYTSLGLGTVQIGSSIGSVDCHIGGSLPSCDETSACIEYSASRGDFHFSAISETDIITLNGERINPGMGNFILSSEDICTVGARVFAFVIPPKELLA